MDSVSLQNEKDQSRHLMVFILVLSLSGLENLIAEIIPELEIGLIEIGVSNFFFVPLALCILFNSWWAAFAAPLGEIIFSDLLLGEFGGLGEFEEVILVAIGLYIAGYLVRDPKNKMQILIAGLVGFVIAELAATFIDIAKVWIGVEELEAVEGLPESIVVLEFIDFGVEFIISGIIFGVLPAMSLTPKLNGKIEPLMGLKPRSVNDPAPSAKSGILAAIAVIGAFLAGIIAVLSEMGLNLVEWEPEFLDSVGEWFIWVAISVSALVAIAVLIVRSSAQKKTGVTTNS